MARPVLGVDLGHGETAVFLRVNGRIFPLRLDAAGNFKMITAIAIIHGSAGCEIVLIGNALRGYETLRKLSEADVKAVSGANFRALLLEYTTILHNAAPDQTELTLPISCDPEELDADVRQALMQAIDACSPEGVHFTPEKGTYFSPLYQTFKAPPQTEEVKMCAVTWNSISNSDGVYQRNMGELMELFLRTLAARLADYNPEEWQSTHDGVDIHIGVPALKEWLVPEAVSLYSAMVARSMQTWLRQPEDNAAPEGAYPMQAHVSVHPEPCAALMAYFREYPESRMQNGFSVADHGSGSLDYCCIALQESTAGSILCRITGSTDQCGGRMIEDGMLRRLVDQEELSVLRDLRTGEASALRLQLRLLKEAYYTAPDEIGDLPQQLRIHLKDGSVRTVSFTVRNLIRPVVCPGSVWHNTVSNFAENMSAALSNQGVRSDSIFLTGGTANVTEAQEIFSAAGLGECRLSGDTSASVADGLCRMITHAELDEFRSDIAAALSTREPEVRSNFEDDLFAALYTVLPSIVTESVHHYMRNDEEPLLSFFSFRVEKLLRQDKELNERLQKATLDYAAARHRQLNTIVTELAQERFPGRLPPSPQISIDLSTIVPETGKMIARHFVHRLDLYGLLGSILYGILQLLGKAKANPRLHTAELDRIARSMRRASASGRVRNAIRLALADTGLCTIVDSKVIDEIVGYLTLTHFDNDLQL